MFNINAAVIPAVRTRQALLILDFQHDFLAHDGALPVEGPDDLVPRTLELAKAFRESGAGDVFWVRSEFEKHRSLSVDGDKIFTKGMVLAARKNSSRARNARAQDMKLMEADDEAFLSMAAEGDKPVCVQPRTPGAQFVPDVQAAIDKTRDVTLTKSHYSAFASAQHQLVQALRGRFVTEIFICGALTNVSIYATTLDAGRHAYATTLVQDCCGYREELRHSAAVQQLITLTGCEVMDADEVIANLDFQRGATQNERPSFRTTSPTPATSHSTSLSPTISRMTLSADGSENSPLLSPPILSSKQESKPATSEKMHSQHKDKTDAASSKQCADLNSAGGNGVKG